MEKKTKQVRHAGRTEFFWAALIAVILAIVVVSYYFYNSLTAQLFSERQNHLTELTIKISEIIDTTSEALQSKSETSRMIIEKGIGDVEGQKDIATFLQETRSMVDLSTSNIFVFDTDGSYYSSSGKVGSWEQLDDLVGTIEEPVIRQLEVDGETHSFMVFFSDFSQPISVGEVTLTHAAIVVPMNYLEAAFSISGFDDQCYTYMVNKNGKQLYKQTYAAMFIEEENVLDHLEMERFIRGGTAEDLREAVSNREQLCLEFHRSEDNADFFVSTTPIIDTNWSVLLFVPTSVLSENSGTFMMSMVIYFIFIAAAVSVIFGMLIVAIISTRNNRRMVLQQQEANAQLAEAAAAAENANRAKSEFLSHMSHDIRTPINGIIGMTNIALKNVSDENRVNDCLQKIDGSAAHLLTLVNDVLDMSRIESGKIIIAHEPLDVRTVLENCSSIISGQLLSRKLTFRKEFGQLHHPLVLGDELHLRQVFINILGNAVKFTPDGGTVTLRAKEVWSDGSRVTHRFEVEDTGIGMSEKFQEQIFEAFSQEDGGSRTTYKGTGLGMAITKQFVDLMGGTITVKSKLNVGSCFVVEITFDINQNQVVHHEVSHTFHLKGLRVLLVEDNELNLEIAEELLSDEGIVVTSVTNGKEAVDCFLGAAPGTFDVILMDIMMPVMDGYQATAAIRSSSHPEGSTIPIIAMTANAYDEDIRKSREMGMNDHIAKPIDMDRLFAVLHQYDYHRENDLKAPHK